MAFRLDHAIWREETRNVEALRAAAAAAVLVGFLACLCAGPEEDGNGVVVIGGIPWFNALENGMKKAGTDFGIDASVVGPPHLDPAQQVKLQKT